MESKKITGGVEAKKQILRAVKEMADVVGSTMGSRGRNVLLESLARPGKPEVVNDGVKIAREFFYFDPVENMAVQLIKEASIRTNDDAGDGTTCATVLAGAIVEEGYKHIINGASPVLLKHVLCEEAKQVQSELQKLSVKIKDAEQLIQVAQISVQDEKLGAMIGSAMFKCGKDGAISVEDNVNDEIVVEESKGARFEMGHAGGVISDHDRFEHKGENVRFLVMNYNIEDHEFDNRWLPFINKLIKLDEKGHVSKVEVPALVIITEKLPLRVLQFINDPHNSSLVKITWVRPPSFGDKRTEILKDFCALTGAKLVDKEDAVYINRISVEELGQAKTVHITRSHTTVSLEEDSVLLKNRIETIKTQIETSNSALEIENLKKRLAVLTGGMATVKVGGSTGAEVKELKLRIEDAINASRSAMEAGLVPGGGVALLDAVKAVEANGLSTVGFSFVQSFLSPFRKILENAGYANEAMVDFIKKREKGEGINVTNFETGDMIKMGIVDPIKVISRALANAVSVAGLLFTADFSLTIEKNNGLETIKKILKDG